MELPSAGIVYDLIQPHIGGSKAGGLWSTQLSNNINVFALYLTDNMSFHIHKLF